MDYHETAAWAEREHQKWISSFGDEPQPELDEDRIVGDDDDTPDIEEKKGECECGACENHL